jgi:signal transduction histidine kinase
MLLVGLTHDMRSPLFAMLGYLQLLQQQLEKNGTENSRQYVQLARQAGLRLDHMLTEALDSARFGHPLPPVQLQPIRLRDLFERLWGTFQIIAGEKQIHLNMILKGNEDVIIQADPSFLERALDNLIANAIKFSPAGRDVVLTGYKRDSRVYFEVNDRGRGIPKEDQTSIFEPFHQVHPGDQSGGFGLGLAIVRFIARAHGGDIHVASEPGMGTCFTLWIPAALASNAS